MTCYPFPGTRMVEGEGFEPSKAEPADLQSAPFDRSGTPPSKRAILAVSVPAGQTATKQGMRPRDRAESPCQFNDLRPDVPGTAARSAGSPALPFVIELFRQERPRAISLNSGRGARLRRDSHPLLPTRHARTRRIR